MIKDKKLKLSNLRPESRDITLYKKLKLIMKSMFQLIQH